MPPKISIGACRRAIAIAGGSLPVMIHGEPVPITRALRTQGTHWVCGDIQLPRASQEALTTKARAIIVEDERPLIPPTPPTISIRECQHAIEVAGGISITLRGTPMRITTLATRNISQWVSGEIRFTPKEKAILTQHARAISGRRSVSTLRIPARGEVSRRAATASRTGQVHGQERQDESTGTRRRRAVHHSVDASTNALAHHRVRTSEAALDGAIEQDADEAVADLDARMASNNALLAIMTTPDPYRVRDLCLDTRYRPRHQPHTRAIAPTGATRRTFARSATACPSSAHTRPPPAVTPEARTPRARLLV